MSQESPREPNEFLVDQQSDAILAYYVGGLYLEADRHDDHMAQRLDADNLEMAVGLATVFDIIPVYHEAAYRLDLLERLDDADFHELVVARFLPSTKERLDRSIGGDAA